MIKCLLVLLLSSAYAGDLRAGQNENENENEKKNRANWMLNCQGCHRADGSATGSEVPALKNVVSRFVSIDGGREYLVRVPGVAMSPLDDAAIASLTNWMLKTFDPQHMPQNFMPFTAVEVGGLRKRPLVSGAAGMRAKLMQENRGVF